MSVYRKKTFLIFLPFFLLLTIIVPMFFSISEIRSRRLVATFSKLETTPVKVSILPIYAHDNYYRHLFVVIRNDKHFQAIYLAINKFVTSYDELSTKLGEWFVETKRPTNIEKGKSVAFYFTKEGAKIDPKTKRTKVSRREIRLWKFWEGDGQKGKVIFSLKSPNNEPAKFTLSVNGGTWVEEVIKLRPLAVLKANGDIDQAATDKRVENQFRQWIRKSLSLLPPTVYSDGMDNNNNGLEGPIGLKGLEGLQGENGTGGNPGKSGKNAESSMVLVFAAISSGVISFISLLLIIYLFTKRRDFLKD